MSKIYGELNVGDVLYCVRKEDSYFEHYKLKIIEINKDNKYVITESNNGESYMFYYDDNNDIIQKRKHVELQTYDKTIKAWEYNDDLKDFVFETLEESRNFVFNICRNKITEYLKTIIEVSRWKEKEEIDYR